MNKKLKILLIEDDRIEVVKFKRAISDEFKDLEILQASNGNEALHMLSEPYPHVIVLDLNMPDTDGIEFLSILKNDDNINHIPVIILTTSNNEKDIDECYRLGIAGYFIKPLKYEDYEQKIKMILNYFKYNEFLTL